MVKMLAENERLEKEVKRLRGWHDVVTECERIFGCPDTAETAYQSNLPNLCRDALANKREA